MDDACPRLMTCGTAVANILEHHDHLLTQGKIADAGPTHIGPAFFGAEAPAPGNADAGCCKAQATPPRLSRVP